MTAHDRGHRRDGKQGDRFLAGNDCELAPCRPQSTLAHDYAINDNDYRRTPSLHDGIDCPYLEEELKVRYSVEFARTPVNERLVFCNAVYLGETKIRNNKRGYAQLNHVWLVDFLRANNVNLDSPLYGLLLISSKRWRFGCLPDDPRTAFGGLCAVSADRRRDIIAIETGLEAQL